LILCGFWRFEIGANGLIFMKIIFLKTKLKGVEIGGYYDTPYRESLFPRSRGHWKSAIYLLLLGIDFLEPKFLLFLNGHWWL